MESSQNGVLTEQGLYRETETLQNKVFTGLEFSQDVSHTHNAHIFIHMHELLDYLYISVKMALEF